MSRPTLTKLGQCAACGCTDEHACEGGCSWVDVDHTICSACLDPFIMTETDFEFRELLELEQCTRLLDVLAEELRERARVVEGLAVATDLRAIQLKMPEKADLIRQVRKGATA